jgi:hypothetical protein
MGQQQLLLIILGVIIIGIAIAVGLSMFTSQSVGANRDALISDLTNLAADAYQHFVRPISMGGGGGVYNSSKGGNSYSIPPSLISNENGAYRLDAVNADDITFTAVSAPYTTDSITGKYGRDGKLIGSFSFAGPNFSGT